MINDIKIWTLLLVIIFVPMLKAQDSITLENCYVLSRQNYPLLKQQRILETIKDYTIENLSKGYLPNLSINGQASYQSDVTELPLSCQIYLFQPLIKINTSYIWRLISQFWMVKWSKDSRI